MEKILLKSKEEFDSFIDENTGYDPGYGIVKVCGWGEEEPKSYPCIAVWEIQYDRNGPDMLEYELVYPEDFKAK